MKLLCNLVFITFMAGAAGVASADNIQVCYDMYPEDSYEAEERSRLMQECLASYSEETQADEAQPADASSYEEPAYYEGTVEDFVKEAPAEEPVMVE